MAKDCGSKAYRFLVYANDRKFPRKGCIQYLATMEPSNGRYFFGRSVRPEMVDMELLRSWLDRCRYWHDNECDAHWFECNDVPRNLRLIDVQRRCIVRKEEVEAQEYVALSYMWGVEKMRLETGMVPALLKRRHIMVLDQVEIEDTPLPDPLPQTIDDAIWLTQELGYRYLWVDALCIVQDDAYEQKVRHLASMAVIYSHATLTIAAAAGDHADYGLPGISVRRKERQYSENVGGIQLATMFPSYTALENSISLPWNTRAWTFQEKLLSRRILLFTDQQVYFKCSESIWTEEIYLETRKLSTSLQGRKRKYAWTPERGAPMDDLNALQGTLGGFNHPNLRLFPSYNSAYEWNYLGQFLSYAAAVQEYTSRQLSDPRDSLFAIQGVLSTLESSIGTLVQGLPETYFLDALLWFSEAGSTLTRRTRTIPSWSWAGWKFGSGRVRYCLTDVRALRVVCNLLTTYEEKVPANEDQIASRSDDSQKVEKKSPFSWAPLNLISCLGWMTIFPDHSARSITYYSGTEARSLSFLTAIDVIGANSKGEKGQVGKILEKMPFRRRSTTISLNCRAKSVDQICPSLYLKTVVVSFYLGDAIGQSPRSNDSNEVRLFELLDADGFCVGEVWTTVAIASKARRHSIDFLTITWGLGMEASIISDEYVPKWSRTSLPDMSREERREFANQWKLRIDLGTGGMLVNGLRIMSGKNVEMEQDQTWVQYMGGKIADRIQKRMNVKTPAPERIALRDEIDGSATAGTLMEQVLLAEAGSPRPRELWTVVNLMAVAWKDDVAHRIGVGKVIRKAWQEQWSSAKTVILM